MRAICFAFLLLVLATNTLFARPQTDATGALPSDQPNSKPNNDATSRFGVATQNHRQEENKSPDDPPPKAALNVFGSWRFRAEAWDWFQASSGRNNYVFAHSLLRAGIGQKRESFDWLIEGAQDAILGLPGNAIAPGNQGQLGLGGTYYVANGNKRNVASGFLKQGYVGIHFPWNGKLTLGRFGFSDGVEVTPADPMLAEIVNTRIAQRLIGEFNYSAVMRSFDGVHLSVDAGKSNFTLVAVRPTEGAFQVDAMGDRKSVV